MSGRRFSDIRPGKSVKIILKEDQRTGKRAVGFVKDILTAAAFPMRAGSKYGWMTVGPDGCRRSFLTSDR